MKIDQKGMAFDIRTKASPNRGGEISPSLIVLHDTAGAIENESSIAWLCNPQARASAHFVIDRLGKITQLVSCNIKAWHAGKSIYQGRQNVNDFSIGIEHVNPGKMLVGGKTAWGRVYDPDSYPTVPVTTPHHGSGHWMPYTELQLASSLELILALRDRYGIEDIAPHWEISPGRKVDTNPLFPLAQFRGKLEGRQDSSMLIQVMPGAIFRKWPSFFAANELDKPGDDDGWFLPIKTGTYKVEGDLPHIPNELRSLTAPAQLWYNINVTTSQSGGSPYAAWIWAGHVKEIRA